MLFTTECKNLRPEMINIIKHTKSTLFHFAKRVLFNYRNKIIQQYSS